MYLCCVRALVCWRRRQSRLDRVLAGPVRQGRRHGHRQGGPAARDAQLALVTEKAQVPSC
eukprot:5170556-Pleurochrysis_carterae.AAC.2